MTPQQVRIIRVFVSSPGDVRRERECVGRVLQRINREPGLRDVVRVEAWQWEQDAAPQIGPPVQDVIDWQTPPFEIYVGIMSARFGTPTGPFGSGTEQEFRHALQQWRETGQPRILLYFDADPKPSTDPQEAQQWPLVCQFRKELEGLGLIGTYKGVGRGKQSFPDQLEQHLREVVHDLLRAPPLPCPAARQAASCQPSVHGNLANPSCWRTSRTSVGDR